MKAVILAGGLGTRLRPLTYSIPKPLIPLAGKPLVRRIIDSLPSSVDTVILAVSYMKDALEEHFQVDPCGRKVILINETTPMGTGGAIKNVAQHLDGTFIALNGDCVSSLDLKAMVKEHRENGGIGTIALWEVPDPSAFGVVAMDKANRISVFQEKPKKEEALSNLINAGAYVFEPEILDYIGKGQVSIEREVFPVILDYGLFGHRFQGFWVDCGTRENMLLAQRLILEREPPEVPPEGVECEFVQPCLVQSRNLRCARLGPNVWVDREVKVEIGATVENSMLMKGSSVGAGSAVINSIVGPGQKVGAGQSISDAIVASR